MASLMIMDLEPRPGSGVADLSPEELMAKFDQLIASGDIIFTLSVSRRYVEIASDSMFLETSRHEVIHMTDYMLPEAVPIVHSEWNPFASEVDFFDLLTKRAAFQLFTELRAYSDGSANDYRDLELLASPLAGPESLNARLELIHKSWVERLPVATQNLLASLKRTNHEAWWAMLNNIYAETFTLFEKYGYQPDPRVQGVSCQFRLKFQGL
ncbi:MAG: hypothetical protein HRT45_19955 [Bdellovibrionales bacterium]|nr:hypothetical protein [Bdellovibrionales bacterium]